MEFKPALILYCSFILFVQVGFSLWIWGMMRESYKIEKEKVAGEKIH